MIRYYLVILFFLLATRGYCELACPQKFIEFKTWNCEIHPTIGNMCVNEGSLQGAIWVPSDQVGENIISGGLYPGIWSHPYFAVKLKVTPTDSFSLTFYSVEINFEISSGAVVANDNFGNNVSCVDCFDGYHGEAFVELRIDQVSLLTSNEVSVKLYVNETKLLEDVFVVYSTLELVSFNPDVVTVHEVVVCSDYDTVGFGVSTSVTIIISVIIGIFMLYVILVLFKEMKK